MPATVAEDFILYLHLMQQNGQQVIAARLADHVQIALKKGNGGPRAWCAGTPWRNGFGPTSWV